MFDIIGKLGEVKEKMEEVKQRLDSITVEGATGGREVRVTANANRKIVNVEIEPSLLENPDIEQLEDYITIAVNRAIESANAINETETQAATRELLPPGFPGA